MLADELALMPASLNHHLTRLVESGIVGYTNEGKGWRRYFLRGGSLSNAVAFFQQNCSLVLHQRMAALEPYWKRTGEPMEVELPEPEHASFMLGLTDHRPITERFQRNRTFTLDE